MLFKQSKKYVEGGYARGGFGSRIYTVVKIYDDGTMKLKRLGDTNKGVFKFHSTTKTFMYTIYNCDWYKPVEPV